MRFAFLGIDRHVAELAAAVAASDQHEVALVWREDSPWTLEAETTWDLKAGLADVPVVGGWYEGLLHAKPDVVVVAAHEDATALQANFRRLVTLGHTIVASHDFSAAETIASAMGRAA